LALFALVIITVVICYYVSLLSTKLGTPKISSLGDKNSSVYSCGLPSYVLQGLRHNLQESSYTRKFGWKFVLCLSNVAYDCGKFSITDVTVGRQDFKLMLLLSKVVYDNGKFCITDPMVGRQSLGSKYSKIMSHLF